MAKEYIAQVMNNDSQQHPDAQKDGRVQIYIPELHYGFQTDQYPWARQDRNFSSNIPEVDDLVWVYFHDEVLFKKPFYKNKVNLLQKHDHGKTIGSLTGIYPDIKYIYLKNGVSIALNSNEPEASIKAGNAEIFISSSGEIHIKSEGDSIINSSGSVTIKNQAQNMKLLVDALFDLLVNFKTTGTAPAHVTDPTYVPLIEAEKTKWATLLKE